MPAPIGLGGTIVGSSIVLTNQLLLESKKQQAEKKKKKTEKLEELMSRLYQHIDISLRDPISHGGTPKEPVLLNAKTDAILTIYFTEYLRLFKNMACKKISTEEDWCFYA
jgi:hypothetical protein